MRILLASSEVHPYSKTGGLADMVGRAGQGAGAAPATGWGIVTPLYLRDPRAVPGTQAAGFAAGPSARPGAGAGPRFGRSSRQPGLTVYFIDQPEFYQRAGTLPWPTALDYPDNAERFIFFSKGVAHLALHLAWRPEVVHLNDWQTGFVPAASCGISGAAEGLGGARRRLA